jgi:hypothetical protein
VPDSITVNVPSAQRALRVVLAIVGFVALLLIGIAIGTRIFAPEPFSGLATSGSVHQVRLASGAVYVGRITSSSGGYLRMADPAIIRQGGTAPSASAAPLLVVEALSVEPYDVRGDLAIVIGSVDWVGDVRPGSDLEAAYRQAVNPAGPAPSVAPSSP